MGIILIARPKVQPGVPIAAATIAGLFVEHDMQNPLCGSKFLQMGPPGYRCFECKFVKLMEWDDEVQDS